MNSKLMTGVAAIALILPALVTDAEARPSRGGGHAVSHAPARVSRPSVARPAAVRPSNNHAAVSHAQPRTPLHTQAATRPVTGHPMVGAHGTTNPGLQAHGPSGATQPMHTTSGSAMPARTGSATLSGDKSGSHLPPFQAPSNTTAGAGTGTATNTHGHANAGAAGAGGTVGTKTDEKAHQKSKAERITDLELKSREEKKRASLDTSVAKTERATAAADNTEVQRLKNQAAEQLAAGQNFEKAGSKGNAEASFKASAEASAKADALEKQSKQLTADAAARTQRAGIESAVSKIDAAKADKLANGPKGGGDKPPKGGSGTSGGDKPPKGGSGTSGGDKPPKGGSGTAGGDKPPKGGSGTAGGDKPPKGGSGTAGGDKPPKGDGGGDTGSASASGGGSSGGGSTGGGSGGASGGAASAGSGSSTTAPITAATTGSADTSAANAQSQCLVKITLQDRVLFKDVCTGQWATTPPDAQPVQTAQ